MCGAHSLLAYSYIVLVSNVATLKHHTFLLPFNINNLLAAFSAKTTKTTTTTKMIQNYLITECGQKCMVCNWPKK
jgi:hypothetical protein